ncbi:MAG: ATP-binding protein, partial [FCB group bacterium]|nr:ATP-binding protein [FCB group bacterium]
MGIKVLLVLAEDRAVCESLRATLPERDLLVFEPSLGQGLRRLISLRPDAVIVDDGPHLGKEAVRELRLSSPSVPVIAMSSRGDAETLADYVLAGAKVCLAKPFSCEDLKRAVEMAMVPAAADMARASAAGPAIAEVSSKAHVTQHQTAMRWLNRLAGLMKDPERIGQSLTDAVGDVFDTVRSAVLIDHGTGVRVIASGGMAAPIPEGITLNFASGLMRWFEENACLFDRAANAHATAAVKEMQLLGGRLGVPLVSSGRVCGALIVGEKASGRDYSPEECELLTVMGRFASATIENARLYETVSHHRERVDSILSNVTAGVVLVRADRSISLMNRSAERILRVQASAVIGNSVQKLGSGFADVALRALADGKPRLRQEVRDPAIDATLGLSATPMGDEGVVIIFSKLPEEHTKTEDVAYSPFWEYLASRVAQEIKNPMVAINTFAQLLPRKYDSEDFREAFGEVVQTEVSRINNVVETLFEFARHPRIIVERSGINGTVDNVLRSFEEELKARNITLVKEFDINAPDADIDAVYFSQALHNVVQNAIDAMPNGGKLKIATQGQPEGCKVVVSDSGPGISEQDAPLVMMPFFSTKEQGMGLGLTVASRSMKQHDGDLKLAPNDEGGGAFSLSLPAGLKRYANGS